AIRPQSLLARFGGTRATQWQGVHFHRTSCRRTHHQVASRWASWKTLSRLATNLPRTVLSATNAAESPTALLARREMRSWRLLQWAPAARRGPAESSRPRSLGAIGSPLAATLYRLAHQNGGTLKSTENPNVCARIANRLAELIENVRTVF